MTLGTGIFLSVLLLSTVFLYHTTKNRWNWRKIFKRAIVWPLIIVISISAIGGGGYYFYHQYENRPVVQTELWGIVLGMSENDLLFTKGEPNTTYTPNEDEDLWYDRVFRYQESEGDRNVYFLDGKVRRITLQGDGYYLPSVNGLDLGDSVEDMLDHLGEPSNTIELSGGHTRVYSYKNYNSLYAAKRNRIVWISISDFSQLEKDDQA